MAFPTYLAMTEEELQFGSVPQGIARTGCRFSLLHTGLSQIPQTLPRDALLILDDCIPIHGSDPEAVCSVLCDLCSSCSPAGIVLDFQRKGQPETVQMVQHIVSRVPCSIVVSEAYAVHTDSPVFLTSPPLHKPLADHLHPWAGREIWLEIAPETQELFLTDQGCRITHLPDSRWELPFYDNGLHCHYAVKTGQNWVKFVLSRTLEDLRSLAEEADALGVRGTIGLYPFFCALSAQIPEPEPSPDPQDT